MRCSPAAATAAHHVHDARINVHRNERERDREMRDYPTVITNHHPTIKPYIGAHDAHASCRRCLLRTVYDRMLVFLSLLAADVSSIFVRFLSFVRAHLCSLMQHMQIHYMRNLIHRKHGTTQHLTLIIKSLYSSSTILRMLSVCNYYPVV